MYDHGAEAFESNVGKQCFVVGFLVQREDAQVYTKIEKRYGSATPMHLPGNETGLQTLWTRFQMAN